jgi:uncharacterized Zn ribbon protein
MKECKNCKKEFKAKDYRTQFCGRSCSASYNNEKRGSLSEAHKQNISLALKKTDDVSIMCKMCKKEFLGREGRVFCSKSCGIAYNGILRGLTHSEKIGETTKGKYRGKDVPSIWLLSKRTVHKTIKRMKLGCSRCSWDEGTCDIHHINGRKIDDPHNHENLTLICPNCHRLAHEGKVEKSSLITLKDYLPNNWLDYYYG